MPGLTLKPEPWQPVAGFFGKLPGRGDFIGRHLPKSFLEPWDHWLQAAIATSRVQLGKAWREIYCTSPIWRFALSAGLCGAERYVGILMPSVDRVNRYYPLIIAAPLTSREPLLALPIANQAWFQAAEQLALNGLAQDQLDLDDFSQHVQALGTVPDTGPADGIAEIDTLWPCRWPDTLDRAKVTTALATGQLWQAFDRACLWWSEGSEQITRCLLMCDGLPPVEGFSALLAGDWEQKGWTKKLLTGIAGPDEPSAAEEEAPL